eukprot:4467706-Alexandrium_andersonii.AAC.1
MPLRGSSKSFAMRSGPVESSLRRWLRARRLDTMRVRSSGAALAEELAGVCGNTSFSGPAEGAKSFSTACFL